MAAVFKFCARSAVDGSWSLVATQVAASVTTQVVVRHQRVCVALDVVWVDRLTTLLG